MSMLTAPDVAASRAVACPSCQSAIPDWRAFCPECRHARPQLGKHIPGLDPARYPTQPDGTVRPTPRRRPRSSTGFRTVLWAMAALAALVGSYGASAAVRAHSHSSAASGPRVYQPVGARFAIDFPMAPHEATRTVAAGPFSTRLTMATVSNQHGVLAAGYSQLPAALAGANPDATLTGAVNGFIALQHGRVTAMTRTIVGGAPAADVTAAVDKGVLQARVVLGQGTIYVVLGGGDAQNSFDYVSFVRSFRLIAQ